MRARVEKVDVLGWNKYFVSWQFQLRPRHRGIVGHATGRVTEIVDHKGEVGHSPEGGGGKFEQDLKGGTVRVDYKGETTKSGYLNFNPVRCPQSNGGQQEVMYNNISETPGVIQVQISVIIQLYHQIYQSHRSLVKG